MSDNKPKADGLLGMNPPDAIQLIRTMTQHISYVQEGLKAAAQNLERRALVHDRSKFSPDEFAAFTRINAAAREHPYGSEEYKAGLRQEKPTIELHYKRNSHHPEHHETEEWAHGRAFFRVEMMGWLDIVEMVFDWRSAYLSYGSQGTWEENMERQHGRYEKWFSPGQWWLIDQVAAFAAAEIK